MPPLALWPDRNQRSTPDSLPKTCMMYIGTATLPNLTTFQFKLSSKIRPFIRFLLKKRQTQRAQSLTYPANRLSRMRSPLRNHRWPVFRRSYLIV